MTNHGYSKKEVELICNRIEKWVNGLQPLPEPAFEYVYSDENPSGIKEICHYFPLPDKPLEMYFEKSKMVIATYDGALRVYKYLTGKKPAGFEQFGKDEIYY